MISKELEQELYKNSIVVKKRLYDTKKEKALRKLVLCRRNSRNDYEYEFETLAIIYIDKEKIWFDTSYRKIPINKAELIIKLAKEWQDDTKTK